MIPALVRCAGGEDASCGAPLEIGAAAGVISTGTSTGAASPLNLPSRANRRHVNNWLVDSPLRRAVTDTKRGPP